MKIENVGLYFFPIRTFCNVFLNYSTHCAQISWWWTGIYRAQTTRTVPHLSSGGLCQNCHFQTKLKSISQHNILASATRDAKKVPKRILHGWYKIPNIKAFSIHPMAFSSNTQFPVAAGCSNITPQLAKVIRTQLAQGSYEATRALSGSSHHPTVLRKSVKKCNLWRSHYLPEKLKSVFFEKKIEWSVLGEV